MSDSCESVSFDYPRGRKSWTGNHLDANLLIDAVLFVLDILLELLQSICVRCGAVSLEYCDVTVMNVKSIIAIPLFVD